MSADQVDDTAEPGIGVLVLRVLGIAALVIVGSATLFAGLGQLDGDTVLAADSSEEPDESEPAPEPAPEPDPAPAPESPDEPAAEPDPEGDEADVAEDDPDTDPETGPEPDPEPDDPSPEDGAEDGSTEAEPDPEPDSGEDQPLRIEPDTVSVQVLDGYQQDGGSAADAVAAQLADEGYRIVARNPALRYDVTAVLWTAGNEEAGKQIARDIGAAEVREQPGNLSTAVMVHVVVGADRG